MGDFFNQLGKNIINISDTLCTYPEFILLIGGGLFLFFFSGAISIRKFPASIRAMRQNKSGKGGKGEISSLQAMFSAIAATVGMGNIAGVAMGLWIGGPGVIFWMWVSAIVGMTTKFFEGTLSVMYKDTDKNGNPQGGPMYIITQGLGKKWKPLAVAFAVFGLVGTLCLTQANQLVESVVTVFNTPSGLWWKAGMGVAMAAIVATVILGGIDRIGKIASGVVPTMVILYLVLVGLVMVLYYDRLPGVFSSIVTGAFNFKAGFGAFAIVALTGARRATLVNEAGVGTASMMHGASSNREPAREGLIAMIEPLIDSGIVCTLTSIPIILAMTGQLGGNTTEGVKGLSIALGAFDQLLPHVGQYLLMVIVFFFAFSTMFSYSYYGQKCSAYLFGPKAVKYYNYYYLAMIVVAAVISLDVMVSIMDLAFLCMAVCTMTALLLLAPKVMKEANAYFKKEKLNSTK